MAYLKGLFVVLMISMVLSLKYNPIHDANEIHELSESHDAFKMIYNKPVYILNKASNSYLVAKTGVNERPSFEKTAPTAADSQYQWTIQQAGKGKIGIKSVSLGAFIQGIKEDQRVTLSTDSPKTNRKSQWKFSYTGEQDWFRLQNPVLDTFLTAKFEQNPEAILSKTSGETSTNPLLYFKLVEKN